MLQDKFNRLADQALVFPQDWAQKFTGPRGTAGQAQLSRILQSGHTQNKGWHAVINQDTHEIIGMVQIERSSGPYLPNALEDMDTLHGVNKDWLRANNHDISYTWHIRNAISLDTPIHVELPAQSKSAFVKLPDDAMLALKKACPDFIKSAGVKTSPVISI